VFALMVLLNAFSRRLQQSNSVLCVEIHILKRRPKPCVKLITPDGGRKLVHRRLQRPAGVTSSTLQHRRTTGDTQRGTSSAN
jgi:hypothetical protein